MKKIVLICVTCLTTFTFVSGQSFQKGSMAIEASIGLGIYNDIITDKTTNTTDYNGAASVPIPISFEYGISRFIGVGARLGGEGYIHNKDSTGRAKGSDFGFFSNIHIIRHRHIDLFAGVGLGVTSFKYTGTVHPDYVKGSGAYVEAHVESRFLLTSHFGVLVYYSLLDKNDANGYVYDTHGNKGDKFGVSFAGSNLGVGLVYKIR